MRLVHAPPILHTHAHRMRAFANGQLELVLGEYAASTCNGALRLRPLHRARSIGRLSRSQTALLAMRGCALNQPENSSQLRLARPHELLLSRWPSALSKLPEQDYPAYLVGVGTDRFGRPCWLQPTAAKRWLQMQHAAAVDQIELELVSGFRSVSYQRGIWQRKLARGQSIEEIAQVSAPPGRSEHHSGRAVDLASGEGLVLEQTFARTKAYRWLKRHASRYGFVETYPRKNPYGIVAEPWHWCWERCGVS